MSNALPMLAAIVQRGILLAGNAASERALVASSERKLTRLGFDLHDGPIQDVALLGEDLRLFRDQLELVLGPLSENKLVRGRIEDLDAQLVAIDSELRRLSTEVQAASVLLQRPFRDALRDRILQLWNNPEKCAAFSEAAKNSIRDSRTHDVFWHEVMSLARECALATAGGTC